MNNMLKWRVMCFECEGEKLVKIIDVGELDLSEVQGEIKPDDSQQMCGSYRLDSRMIAWLNGKVKNHELLEGRFDMFLERET